MPYFTRLDRHEIEKLTPGQQRLREIIQANMDEYESVHNIGRTSDEYQKFCIKINKLLDSELLITQDSVTGRDLLEERFFSKTFYSFLQITGRVTSSENKEITLDQTCLKKYDYNRYDRNVSDWSAYRFANIGNDFVGIYFKVMNSDISLDSERFWIHQFQSISNYQFSQGNHRGLALHLLSEPKVISVEKYFEYQNDQYSAVLQQSLNEALKKIENHYPNLDQWSIGIKPEDVIYLSQNISAHPTPGIKNIRDAIKD